MRAIDEFRIPLGWETGEDVVLNESSAHLKQEVDIFLCPQSLFCHIPPPPTPVSYIFCFPIVSRGLNLTVLPLL